MQRTFVVLAFGLLCGGVIGAYATTTVYGKRQPTVTVAPGECPACPACRECPKPVDCETPPPVVSADDPPGLLEEEYDLGVGGTPKTGLPATAIGLASAAFGEQIGPCMGQARSDAVHGSLLLDLTVTTTAGRGRILNAQIAQSEGPVDELADCVKGAVTGVGFDWPHADGESRLRYPIVVTAE